MNQTVNPHAPYVSRPCNLCEAGGIVKGKRRTIVVKTLLGQMLDNEPVQNFGPFNAHRSCYNAWHIEHYPRQEVKDNA